MKILHIASLGEDVYGGVRTVVPKYLESQQNYEDVALLNIKKTKIKNINILYYYSGVKSFVELVSSEFKPDLVVFHEVYYPIFCILGRILKSKKIKYIIVPHGCLTYQAQSKKRVKKSIANFIAFDNFVSNSILVQYLSENERNDSKRFKLMKSIVISNAVDIPQVKKSSFNSEKTNIVYIGRLDVYHKGLDLMIKAIIELEDFLKKNNVLIKIFGPIDEKNKLLITELINLKYFSSLIEIHGSVTGSEKDKILLDSDIFIQTSRFEGMPLGVLEALSYGLPCLVSTGTNLGKEVLQYDSGWVCETNLESLMETFRIAVLDKKSYYDKSIRAVSLIENNFTWDIITKTTLDFYKKIK